MDSNHQMTVNRFSFVLVVYPALYVSIPNISIASLIQIFEFEMLSRSI